MDVRWASRSVYAVIGQKLGELARSEFAGIVAVECADDAYRPCCLFVCMSREIGNESTDVCGCLRFLTHVMNWLAARVVIHKHKRVLIPVM
eukprot:5184813-Pleurochrysis_carterae.AAC.1